MDLLDELRLGDFGEPPAAVTVVTVAAAVAGAMSATGRGGTASAAASAAGLALATGTVEGGGAVAAAGLEGFKADLSLGAGAGATGAAEAAAETLRVETSAAPEEEEDKEEEEGSTAAFRAAEPAAGAGAWAGAWAGVRAGGADSRLRGTGCLGGGSTAAAGRAAGRTSLTIGAAARLLGVLARFRDAAVATGGGTTLAVTAGLTAGRVVEEHETVRLVVEAEGLRVVNVVLEAGVVEGVLGR